MTTPSLPPPLATYPATPAALLGRARPLRPRPHRRRRRGRHGSRPPARAPPRPGRAHPAGPVPPSPSRLPAWVTATEPPPVYSAAPAPPPVYTTAGDPPRPSFPDPPHARFAEPSAGRAEYPAQGATGLAPPRYAKLEFATYDGVEDPLNWLNQCEQFFRGQRTLASDRTWLASYHLCGAAQTWYYSLEHDEGGMPPWDRFRELCLLRFGPPIRGSRLAELGRLAFTTTVQDFADRFQALACHAPGVTGQQRAELFIGGLPDHIRVDVELQAPQDLQTAMHYARAYERRAQAVQQAPLARGTRAARPPPTATAANRPAPPGPTGPAPAATRTFRRLTRRSSSNAAAWDSASTATTHTRPVTCVLAYSTWRQSTWRKATRRPGQLPRRPRRPGRPTRLPRPLSCLYTRSPASATSGRCFSRSLSRASLWWRYWTRGRRITFSPPPLCAASRYSRPVGIPSA
nr:uncharacterized protein LOC127309928 [Lolium perenne]